MSTPIVRWLAVGVPALVTLAVAIVFGIRVGMGITWGKILGPMAAFLGLQLGTYVGMFWARNRARSEGDYRLATVLAGFYCWASGLMVMHYGTEWGILRDYRNDDPLVFSILLALITGMIFAVVWFSKSRRTSPRR